MHLIPDTRDRCVRVMPIPVSKCSKDFRHGNGRISPPFDAIVTQLSMGIDIIIHITRNKEGRRFIDEILLKYFPQRERNSCFRDYTRTTEDKDLKGYAMKDIFLRSKKAADKISAQKKFLIKGSWAYPLFVIAIFLDIRILYHIGIDTYCRIGHTRLLSLESSRQQRLFR